MAGTPAQLAQASRGLADIYAKLHAHQLAVYHGLPLAEAQRLKAGVRGLPLPEEVYRDRISIGGLGSGKSFGGVFTCLTANASHPDNIWLVLRKRHEQMENSIIRMFERMADQATDGHAERLIERLPDHAGAIEFAVFTPSKPSKIVFRIEPDGDDATIQDSLKAYEIGGYILEEATQLRHITFQTIRTRVRLKTVPRMGLTLSNPATVGHWLVNYARQQEALLSEGKRAAAVVIRSKTKDNAANQSDGYYQQIKEIYGDDEVMLAMMLEGEDGVVIDGVPVYKGYFKPNIHVDREIHMNPFLPLYRGIDFGWNKPFAVFVQREKTGHCTVIAELSPENITADNFAHEIKAYTAEHMPKFEYAEDWGDPAMLQHSDKSPDTTQTIFHKNGLTVRYKRARVPPGIDLIRYLLSTYKPDSWGNIRPLLTFHPRCQELITAMHLGYHYRKSKQGIVAEIPHKPQPHDHGPDALRYILTGICGVANDGAKRGGKGETFCLPPDPVRKDW